MTAELIVWLASLAAVFLVGWAWGRSGRRVVVVNFPERPALNALRPTAHEVAVAMRATDDGDTRKPRVTAGHADDAQEESVK